MKPLMAALGYSGAGWRVAPAAPGMKHPMIPEWQNTATTDVNTIAGWFAGHDDRNVCIATGAESGIWVLDVDDKEPCGCEYMCGKGSHTLHTLEAEHEDLPPTWTVGTGSGGCHFYWTWDGVDFPLRNSAGKLGPGLDTRGAGGQVVAPPSRASDPTHFQSYTLLAGLRPVPAPTWLLGLLRPAPRPEVAVRNPAETFLPGHDGILGWLAGVMPGGQDMALSWVVRALRDEGKTSQAAGDLLWPVVAAWPCSGGPWTTRDIERHLRSAYKGA